MSISFPCEHCGKQIKAPESAAGKRGKCPHCKQSTYVPEPVSEEEILDFAPVDEEEERRRKEEVRKLMAQEHDIIAETGAQPEVPLEAKEDVQPQDLHHLVVNYCLDMAGGHLERAQTHARKLGQFGFNGTQAVNDFIEGNADEPALDQLPKPVLKGFLNQLKDEIK